MIRADLVSDTWKRITIGKVVSSLMASRGNAVC